MVPKLFSLKSRNIGSSLKAGSDVYDILDQLKADPEGEQRQAEIDAAVER